MGQIVHVVRSPGGGWLVKLGSNERASSEHRSQLEAIVEARRIAKEQKSHLYIHARNGQVRDRFNYDGNPPRSYARW